MRIQDFELLTVLYGFKSLTKASEKLFISQPTLTRRIAQIEEEMGIRILARDTKGITFTMQGEKLVDYAKKMLSEYNELRDSFREEDMYTGTIHISSSYTLARYFLPDLLERFSNIYPHFNFEVVNSFSHETAHLLNSRSTQVAFFCGNYEGAFDKTLLMEKKGYIVNAHPFSMEDLPKLPYIAYQTDRFTEDMMDRWWYEWYSDPPATRIIVRNSDIGYEMVKRGLGYAMFLNENYWAHDSSLFYRQITFKDGKPMTMPSWMGYREESLKLVNIQAFVDYARDFAIKKDRLSIDLGITNIF